MSESDRRGPTGSVGPPSSEADPAPGLLSVLWKVTDDDDLASARRLADAFGALVLEPTRWPEGARQLQYVLNPPNPVSPLFDVMAYGIAAELPGHPVRLIVTGRIGVSPHRSGRHGWFAIAELADVNGLGRDDGVVSHVCVERDGQTLHATMFPSVDEAVATARSLRRVPPAERHEG